MRPSLPSTRQRLTDNQSLRGPNDAMTQPGEAAKHSQHEALDQ